MSKAEIDKFPLILLKGNGPPIHTGMKDAVTLGLSPMLAGTGKAAEVSLLLAQELLRHLHRKLHETTRARTRCGWLGGRWYNAMLGIKPSYITLSGAHLRQVIGLFDLETPQGVEPRTQYLLRADIAQDAHDRLGAQLGVAVENLAQGLS